MKKSPELRGLLLHLYEAMSSGSATRVEAFYSLQPDAIFVGTNDADFWTDSVRHNEDVRPVFDGSRGQLNWTPGNPLARCERSVGWTVDRPTITFSDGSVVKARVSLVWHQEPDGWKIVHSHASIGG